MLKLLGPTINLNHLNPPYIVLQLLKDGESHEYDFDTSLIYACKNNMKDVALRLLEFENVNYNHIDNYGNTALIYACKNNMKDVALRLLEFENVNYNKITYHQTKWTNTI